MTSVDYDFHANLHTESGALKGMRYLVEDGGFTSILDVGAGTGTWLSAASKLGIGDIFGVDGVPIDDRELCVSKQFVRVADLRLPIDLGRTFDAVLCLEVAEHLPPESASTLIESLCRHADLVYFSAAVPHQDGYRHVNCQWPSYWQALFNASGFVCSDSIRFRMWGDQDVEPWYRQNIFVARRNSEAAGHEPRILSVVHPDMIRYLKNPESPFAQQLRHIEHGRLEVRQYARLLSIAMRREIARRLKRG